MPCEYADIFSKPIRNQRSYSWEAESGRVGILMQIRSDGFGEISAEEGG